MVLFIKGVSKKYFRGPRSFYAVKDASLSAEPGEMISIIGPSGCGKSTLFSMISGLIKPDSGSIMVCGQELSASDKKAQAKLRNTKLGYILQGQNLLHNFTVLENICMPGYLGGYTARMQARAMELIEEFGLKDMAGESTSVLSGGEQRRVAVARILAHDPSLIIADEPTSNLDPRNAALIMQALRGACGRGAAVIISSHDRSLVAGADRHYFMNEGVLS